MKTLAIGLLTAVFMVGFGKPKHSKLETNVKTLADGKVELEFKVVPNKGIQVTDEGPWTLTLKKTDGLDLTTKDGKFEIRTYDEKIPGFRLATTASKASGEMTYRVRSFVCEDDKTKCYAEIHKGTLKWQK